MRSKIALSLFMTLLLSVVLTPLASEQVYAADNAKQIMNAIGIMNTDKDNNDTGTAVVVRSRFAQMLVNMSTLQGSVAAKSNVTVFSDVKKTYWASGYIQTAVKQGWMSGYLNGTFKPQQGVTLKEAVYAVVRLLGYTDSDFSGNVSSGIMTLYEKKELNKNITKKSTQYLTVNDCVNLFYNTLTAKTKAGSVYAVTLGYTLDTNGDLNYLSLVETGIKGPIVADNSWKSKLPFTTAAATFSKDGVTCGEQDVSAYDVLYYSESLKMVWVYDNKVTGTIKAITPDYSAPTSVTVNSKTYSFANSTVAVKFSSMGTVKEGNIVTLILDKDNKIVDVLDSDECNVTVTGIVTATGTHLVKNDSGNYEVTYYLNMVDASGNEYEKEFDNSSAWYTVGDIARLTYKNGTAELSHYYLSNKNFNNSTFSSNGSTLGDIKLASNIKILDCKGTNNISIFPSRLAGVSLVDSSVLYYEYNDNGELSQLILNDVTGDMDSYGIYTSNSVDSSKVAYKYMIGDTSGSLSTTTLTNFSLTEGPKRFVFESGTLTASYALTGVTVTSVGTTTIQAESDKYLLADTYYVYIMADKEYVSTTLDKVSNLSKYSLTAYYDDPQSLGGRIRVIIAESK